MKDQVLSDRQKKILYAIVDNHVSTAEPVGSRTLYKKYDLGVSPATIRNDMSDLEDMQFIHKAHSSSGRLPTDIAYRRFVDELIESMNNKLMNHSSKSLTMINYNRLIDTDKVIVEAARVLSSLTNYSCITMIRKSSETTIKQIELMPINRYNLVMVVVYSTGDVGNRIIQNNIELSEEDIRKVNFHMNSVLRNKKINEIQDFENELVNRLKEYSHICNEILFAFFDEMNNFRDLEFHKEGLSNIFNYPEYSSIDKIKEFLLFTDQKENLINLFEEDDNNYFYVKIGEENKSKILADNSVIVSTYLLNEKIRGKIALIAPKRMDYPKIIEAVMTISWKINHMINSRT